MRRNWTAGDGRVVQFRKDDFRALEQTNNEAYALIFGGPDEE